MICVLCAVARELIAATDALVLARKLDLVSSSKQTLAELVAAHLRQDAADRRWDLVRRRGLAHNHPYGKDDHG